MGYKNAGVCLRMCRSTCVVCAKSRSAKTEGKEGNKGGMVPSQLSVHLSGR